MHRLSLACLLLTGLFAGPLHAQGFNDLTGRFVYDDDLPNLPNIVEKGMAPKDPQICAVDKAIPDQSLVVDPKTKGIANVFVYLKEAPATIHPDLVNPPKNPVLFDQQNCTFEPHALFTRAGQGVAVTSTDAAAHNTHTFPIKNAAVNFLLPPKPPQPVVVQTPMAEILPIQVKCDIHPWMTSYWLILDHPYAAITQEDGSFQIKNLPVGKYTFRVWHERVGYLEKELAVTIAAGEATDLKDMKYKARHFKD